MEWNIVPVVERNQGPERHIAAKFAALGAGTGQTGLVEVEHGLDGCGIAVLGREVEGRQLQGGAC